MFSTNNSDVYSKSSRSTNNPRLNQRNTSKKKTKMDENSDSVVRVLHPNEAKHAKLVEIAKKEETQWIEFKEKNRITSIHEIHKLGGCQSFSDVNKARQDYFRQKLPTKLERLERQHRNNLEWKLKEQKEIEDKLKIQREKAELNELKEKMRQITIEQNIHKNRAKFISENEIKIEKNNTSLEKDGQNPSSLEKTNNDIQKRPNAKQLTQSEITKEIRLARENHLNNRL